MIASFEKRIWEVFSSVKQEKSEIWKSFAVWEKYLQSSLLIVPETDEYIMQVRFPSSYEP